LSVASGRISKPRQWLNEYYSISCYSFHVLEKGGGRKLTRAGFWQAPAYAISRFSFIRTPKLPLLPLWEKGAGGMRGQRAGSPLVEEGGRGDEEQQRVRTHQGEPARASPPHLLLLFLLALRQASVERQQTRTVVADEFQVLDDLLGALLLFDLLIDEPLKHAEGRVIILLRSEGVDGVNGAVTRCSCASACSNTSSGDANSFCGSSIAPRITRPPRSFT
jgi:hypothetical protein